MKVVEVFSDGGLPELAAAWADLCDRSASTSIFHTWEWAHSWWTAYGSAGQLRILMAFDDHGELQGIAPLFSRPVKRYGRTYSTLCFIGDGSADSDYLDFITAAGFEAEAMAAFWRHLQPALSAGTLFELNEVPDSSPNLAVLRACCSERRAIWQETDVPCSVVNLPEDWQKYLQTLAPRFRTKIRSVLRNLDEREGVTFRFCRDTKELEALLPSLFDLHGRRWKKEGLPGVFGPSAKQNFYRTLSNALLQRGWLTFSSLDWKGRTLACQYGFVYRGQYSQLQEGYEPASEHWNVGIGLRAWSIQQFLKQGIRTYDFLSGTGKHKSDWGSVVKLSKRIVFGLPTTANLLFCRGPEWEIRTREAVKKRLPARLVSLRESYYERRTHSGGAESNAIERGAPDAISWYRSALAQCYSSSPLPKLLPWFRNRYCLHIPKRSLEKRLLPTARIFYFHRVNDERDPFSYSLSAAVFDRQMRFLARHYKVVSLAEVVTRLADRTPAEPVVAITFDDGFQDNYQYAFPILQRYGLPATIFLTTGSIDSREPLWFERLSHAVKTTTQQFIDVEIDIPRRLPMRSAAERLHTKNQIISLLRPLPDSDRRTILTSLLSVLGEPQDQKDVMLTWDEIRHMKKHAIDFGGHTVTHPFVSKLSPELAQWELSECKRRIESETQAQVRHFAYPNGRPGDFETWNKTVLYDAGYQAAVSTLWGVNSPDTDRMELRRGQPWEENSAVFAAKLDWYQLTDV
jgi:peptidoglycan/xylan/chitin deacetylase (PgdA/CDA1 family)/CelD/BcsL family acetyltransferase involved in cellulose biosynthesis